MDKDTQISAAVAGIHDALKAIEVALNLSQTTGRVSNVLTRNDLDLIMLNCAVAAKHQNTRLKEALTTEE